MFQGLGAADLETVSKLLELRSYKRGQVMVQIGTEANEVFFIRNGEASITVPVSEDSHTRLALFSPGMNFGEVGMLDRAPRSAVVIAETDVECHVLGLENFDRLSETHPQLKITLLRNMATGLAGHLRRVNRAVSVFGN